MNRHARAGLGFATPLDLQLRPRRRVANQSSARLEPNTKGRPQVRLGPSFGSCPPHPLCHLPLSLRTSMQPNRTVGRGRTHVRHASGVPALQETVFSVRPNQPEGRRPVHGCPLERELVHLEQPVLGREQKGDHLDTLGVSGAHQLARLKRQADGTSELRFSSADLGKDPGPLAKIETTRTEYLGTDPIDGERVPRLVAGAHERQDLTAARWRDLRGHLPEARLEGRGPGKQGAVLRKRRGQGGSTLTESVFSLLLGTAPKPLTDRRHRHQDSESCQSRLANAVAREPHGCDLPGPVADDCRCSESMQVLVTAHGRTHVRPCSWSSVHFGSLRAVGVGHPEFS